MVMSHIKRIRMTLLHPTLVIAYMSRVKLIQQEPGTLTHF